MAPVRHLAMQYDNLPATLSIRKHDIIISPLIVKYALTSRRNAMFTCSHMINDYFRIQDVCKNWQGVRMLSENMHFVINVHIIYQQKSPYKTQLELITITPMMNHSLRWYVHTSNINMNPFFKKVDPLRMCTNIEHLHEKPDPML